MKNQFFLCVAMLLISTISYSQIQPYVDVHAGWKIPMEGRVGIDVGANYDWVSIEANSLFVSHSRVGGTVGYQLRERGDENPAMRMFVGAMYGRYYTETTLSNGYKEDVLQPAKWKSIAGVSLMQGSLTSRLLVIPDKLFRQSEIYLSVGFQIVEIYKWAFK